MRAAEGVAAVTGTGMTARVDGQGGAGRERGAALRPSHRCWDSRGARGELAAVGKTPMSMRIADWRPKDSRLAVVDEAGVAL